MNGQRCLLCDAPAELELCSECAKMVDDYTTNSWDSESSDLDECFETEKDVKMTEGFKILKGAS